MKIRQSQIREIAEKLGVPANTVDKDYVIGHFLNELFGRDWALKNFLFKGGTCLKKCYFDNYRFSEDIDITIRNQDFLLKKSNIRVVCETIFEKVGIGLNILNFDEVFWKDKFMGWDSKICFWGANHKISQEPIFGKDCHTFIKLEIRTHERIILENEICNIIHNFPDQDLISSRIPCYSIHEILAEKMRSLIQRSRGEARDYYDLWYIKNNIPGIDWGIVKDTFLQKCEFKNVGFSGIDDFFKDVRLKQVDANGDGRLLHQLPKSMLIDKKTVIEELRLLFKDVFISK